MLITSRAESILDYHDVEKKEIGWNYPEMTSKPCPVT
jgi:hypothetical protein